MLVDLMSGKQITRMPYDREYRSGDFSVELATPDWQSRPIILRKTRFSLKLWTPPIRYGSRISNVSSYL